MVKTGCCGGTIRLLLIIINTIFFIIGLAVFIVAAVLRWSSSSILQKISEDTDAKSILSWTAVDAVSIALLALGGFIILLSLFGLFGACCANKFFLFIYEIIIVALFVSHAIVLTVGAVKSGDVENEFRKLLNQTVADLNSNQTDPDKATAECRSMKLLSELFVCCGYNGASDFHYNTTYQTECCKDPNYTGCGDKIVQDIKSNGINLVVIPNFVILGFEFVIILLVPFLIGRIRRNSQGSRYLEEEGSINVKPTSFHNANYNDY